MSTERDPFDDLVFRHVSPRAKNVTSNNSNTPSSNNSIGNTSRRSPPARRPPRVIVKLYIHEEVSSTQDKSESIDEICSHVLLDGKVEASITTHHPLNPPFSVRISDPDYPEESQNVFQFASNLMTFYGPSEFNTLCVPKAMTQNYNKVKLATYHRSVTKKFMPILAQVKVIRVGANGEFCRVAVQIRSNLNNAGSIGDIDIAMAVPPTVLSKTLSIVEGQGNGYFDEMKRVVRWKVKQLEQGSSVVFGAECEVLPSLSPEEVPKFPLMLRCNSVEDTVSSLQIECRQLDEEHPVILAVSINRSFQLLHRLP